MNKNKKKEKTAPLWAWVVSLGLVSSGAMIISPGLWLIFLGVFLFYFNYG